jgi:CRP/FNR family cyclic AMP-dependent transcriptional regulator
MLSHDEKMRLLRSVGLFADAADDSLAAVAERAGEADFPAGRRLITQGQIGNGLFVVVEGAVRIVRDDDELATFGPGQVVGELGVIDQMPRLASVVASAPTRCLTLSSWDFLDAVERDPKLALGVMRVLAARLRDAVGDHHHH